MQNNLSNQDTLKALSIIHYALIAGLLIFTGVAYYVIGPTMAGGEAESYYSLFRYLIPGVAIMAILFGRFIGTKMLQKAQEIGELPLKLSAYQSIAIVRWSLMEGAGMFAVVAYLLTGNQVFIMVALAAAAYLFTQKPTVNLISQELGLSNEETRELEE